jgi:hypothetical protein
MRFQQRIDVGFAAACVISAPIRADRFRQCHNIQTSAIDEIVVS